MIKVAKALLAQSRIGDLLGRTPFVPQIYAGRIWRKRMNLYFGVFDSFTDAEAEGARYAKSTWDDPALAFHDHK